MKTKMKKDLSDITQNINSGSFKKKDSKSKVKTPKNIEKYTEEPVLAPKKEVQELNEEVDLNYDSSSSDGGDQEVMNIKVKQANSSQQKKEEVQNELMSMFQSNNSNGMINQVQSQVKATLSNSTLTGKPSDQSTASNFVNEIGLTALSLSNDVLTISTPSNPQHQAKTGGDFPDLLNLGSPVNVGVISQNQAISNIVGGEDVFGNMKIKTFNNQPTNGQLDQSVTESDFSSFQFDANPIQNQAFNPSGGINLDESKTSNFMDFNAQNEATDQFNFFSIPQKAKKPTASLAENMNPAKFSSQIMGQPQKVKQQVNNAWDGFNNLMGATPSPQNNQNQQQQAQNHTSVLSTGLQPSPNNVSNNNTFGFDFSPQTLSQNNGNAMSLSQTQTVNTQQVPVQKKSQDKYSGLGNLGGFEGGQNFMTNDSVDLVNFGESEQFKSTVVPNQQIVGGQNQQMMKEAMENATPKQEVNLGFDEFSMV